MRGVFMAAAMVGVLSGSGGAVAQDRDPADVTRPPGTVPFAASGEDLVAVGEGLFDDEGLGSSGMSCNSCHAEFGAFSDTFAQPYPHAVSMAKGMFGLDAVDAEQMVQLCMVVPMEARPLAWESRELAALTAYVLKVQTDFAARPPAE